MIIGEICGYYEWSSNSGLRIDAFIPMGVTGISG